MPRPKEIERTELINRAMLHFWSHGYASSSISELVKATGASRHALYSEFKGKQDLFLACLDHYQPCVVSPAFNQVQEKGADLESVAAYFEFQISRAEQGTLPGPGCLVANTITEAVRKQSLVKDRIEAHLSRMEKGYNAVLKVENRAHGYRSSKDLKQLASLMVTATQGIWCQSRLISDANILRQSAQCLIDLIKLRITTP